MSLLFRKEELNTKLKVIIEVVTEKWRIFDLPKSNVLQNINFLTLKGMMYPALTMSSKLCQLQYMKVNKADDYSKD